MRILLLAPHPFYQDRGTPIDVYLLLRVMSECGHTVDVVTYHEGTDIELEGVTLHRIPSLPLLRNIRPGFSIKKVICDFLMLLPVVRLVRRNRYGVAHAVEESVFILRLLKALMGIPYVYDMDSSLPQQMIEKHPFLAPFSRLMQYCEGCAVRGALAVVPVCDELAAGIARHNPAHVVVLNDISLLEEKSPQGIDLRTELDIHGLLIMYVGNLEKYQGIDLLLSSFAEAGSEAELADLVIVGGERSDITRYRAVCDRLHIQRRVHWLGPKPIADLGAYLREADILVSPRTKGKNTPMKIYSYLHSGKAILATDLPTHTQVLDSEVAVLAETSVPAFSKALRCLMQDADLRAKLGRAGNELIERKYSYRVYRQKVHRLLAWIEDNTEPRIAQMQ